MRLIWSKRPRRRRVLGGDLQLATFRSSDGMYEVTFSMFVLAHRWPMAWRAWFNNTPLSQHRTKNAAMRACDRHARLAERSVIERSKTQQKKERQK